MALKLGKLPKKENPRTLTLAKYVTLPVVPHAFAWEYNLDAWGMMGNDQIGDCTCACAGHMLMEWTSRTYGTVTPTDQQIIAAYSAITGYVPGNESTDNGAAITDVLAYWQNTGIASHKILGWAAIDVSNVANLKAAVALFGAIDIGFNVPQSAMDAFGKGQPWNDTTDTNIVGGHSVPVMGYGGLGCTCITWGQRQQMSWAFFSAYCDEAYACITEDFITRAQVTPVFGLNLAALQADLEALKA